MYMCLTASVDHGDGCCCVAQRVMAVTRPNARDATLTREEIQGSHARLTSGIAPRFSCAPAPALPHPPPPAVCPTSTRTMHSLTRPLTRSLAHSTRDPTHSPVPSPSSPTSGSTRRQSQSQLQSTLHICTLSRDPPNTGSTSTLALHPWTMANRVTLHSRTKEAHRRPEATARRPGATRHEPGAPGSQSERAPAGPPASHSAGCLADSGKARGTR